MSAKPGASVAVVGLFLYATHGHHLPGISAVTTAAHGTVRGGTLNCSGLEALWEQAGGSHAEAFMAAEIAMAESGGQQDATDYDSNGTVDRGYFQINSIWGALSTYDAAGNARAAVQISHDGRDWSPWTTDRTGAYAGRC
jgi:hypothetical protein